MRYNFGFISIKPQLNIESLNEAQRNTIVMVVYSKVFTVVNGLLIKWKCHRQIISVRVNVLFIADNTGRKERETLRAVFTKF